MSGAQAVARGNEGDQPVDLVDGVPAAPPRYFTRSRVASLLSSVGQESTTAVLAPFFAGTLGAAPVVIAGVEAAGRAGNAAARFGGSRVATRRPAARGLLDVAGSVGAALAAGFLAGSGAIWSAGACRAGSWAARGLGTDPNLRPVSEAAVARPVGGRLGLERAFGALGAAAGPLAAIVLLAFANLRTVIFLAAIPAAAAAVVSALGAGRNPTSTPELAAPSPRETVARLRERGPLGRFFAGVALYEAANIAAALLLLRATKVLPAGAGSLSRLQVVALLYVVYQLSAAASATSAGLIADRFGPAVVVAGGSVTLLIAYAGFASAGRGDLALMVGCFVLAGAAAGAVDTAEYTGVARLATPQNRWTALGALAGLQNGGRILATVTAGGLWTLVGPAAGLLVCGPLLVAAPVLLAARPAGASEPR